MRSFKPRLEYTPSIVRLTIPKTNHSNLGPLYLEVWESPQHELNFLPGSFGKSKFIYSRYNTQVSFFTRSAYVKYSSRSTPLTKYTSLDVNLFKYFSSYISSTCTDRTFRSYLLYYSTRYFWNFLWQFLFLTEQIIRFKPTGKRHPQKALSLPSNRTTSIQFILFTRGL